MQLLRLVRGGVISNFSLTVEANGGNWNGNTSQTIEMGQPIEIENPTKTDYVFDRWIIEGEGSSINGTTFTMGAADTTITAQWVKEVELFATVGQTEWPIPVTGYYKLETWGAQGGSYNETYHGGFGGYSIGIVKLTKDNKIYVAVGGKGAPAVVTSTTGGFNGGGTGAGSNFPVYSSSGGGATHIAIGSTNRGTLNNYASYINELLIVSGGGGGTSFQSGPYSGIGGSGGGKVGKNGTYTNGGNLNGNGGNQLSGGTPGNSGRGQAGTFGQGGNGTLYAGGGGAGLYGGGASNQAGAGGGSGYIGNTSLESNKRYMYCYDCEENSDDATYTISTTGTSSLRDTVNCPNGFSATAISKCAKSDDGYAKITYLGKTIE